MTLDEKINNMTQMVMSEIGVMNRGYNPNRDDKTGRFTFGDGSKPPAQSSGSSALSPIIRKDFSDAEKRQIRKNAEQMVREMQPDDKYLASKIDGIGSDLGLQAKKGPIKKSDRMTQKAIEEEGGNIFGMKDVVRATVIVQDYSQIQQTTSRIGEDFEISRVKELSADGYRDVKVNVTMPNSGYDGEFIVIAPEFYQAKAKPTMFKESGHDLYKIIRDPGSSEAAQAEALRKTQLLYADAEKKYLARTSRGEELTIDF